MWQFILKNLAGGFLMCASSNHTQVKESKMASGLISTHAYGFYDAKEFKNSKGQTVKAVKVRNPWGSQELLGVCKIRSDAIMNDLKSKYEISKDEDEGMVWISYEDFLENFDSVTVCKVHNNFKYKFLRSELFKWDIWGLSLVTFDVAKKGLVYLTVHQRIQRHFKNDSTHEYSYVRVFLVKVDQQGGVVEFIKGKFKASQQVVLEKELDVGKYVAFIEIEWMLSQNKDTIDIVVSTYSRHAVKVKNYKYDEVQKLYENIIKAYFNKKTVHLKTTTYSNKMSNIDLPHKIYKLNFFKYGLFVYWIQNEEKDVVFDMKLGFNAPPTNMKLFHPRLQDGSFKYLRLNTGESELVIIKTLPKPLNSPKNSFSYSTGTVYESIQFKYQLNFLKNYIIQNVKPEDFHGVKLYSLSYVGGIAYFTVNKSKGVMTLKINTTCKNYMIDTTEMSNVAPNQKFERNLIENQEYLLLYQLNKMGEESVYPPGLEYGYKSSS
jgi:Calpain family cysteine protease